MNLLVADDDPISRRMLEGVIRGFGYSVMLAADGSEAWRILEEGSIQIAVLDWEMPNLDGAEICQRLRAKTTETPIYVILLTGRNSKQDIVIGLQAGANDYITKPFDADELRARIAVGRTVVELQTSLLAKVRDLESALAQVKQLQGLLPICSYCKKIRDDHNYWQQVDKYIAAHSEVKFTHGICPDCWRDVVQPILKE